MALTVEEQKFFDFAKSALPKFLFQQLRPEEAFGAFAKIFDSARQQIVAYFAQSLILQADGTNPDYLNQHAKDRGTARQLGESDAALRDRLRNIPDALTRVAILAALNSILAAEGLGSTGDALEIRRDRGHFGKFASDTGTGGAYTGVAPDMAFEPTVPYELPIEQGFARSGAQGNPQLVTSGSVTAANNGTFPVTGLADDATEYQNGLGSAEAGPAVTWTLQKRDVNGVVRDGFARAYMGRGYRMGSRALTLILPFGCTSGTLLSVKEMLRQKKGAGILNVSECMNGLDYPQDDSALETALLDEGAVGPALCDSLYDFQEVAVSNALDHVGGEPLSPAGAPAPTQGAIDKEMGSRVGQFDDGGTTAEFVAAAAGAHDFAASSFGILVGFSFDALPTGSPAGIFGKAAGGIGYELHLDTAGVLHWLVDDGTTSVDVIVTPGGPGASFADGKVHLVYCLRDAGANSTNLITGLGQTVGADVPLTLANAGLFRVGANAGLNGHPSGAMNMAYMSIFTGGDATIIGLNELSNLRE